MIEYRVDLKVRTHGSEYDQEVREICNRTGAQIKGTSDEKELTKKGYKLDRTYSLSFECSPVEFLDNLESFKIQWKAKIKKLGGVVYYHLSKPKMEINMEKLGEATDVL